MPKKNLLRLDIPERTPVPEGSFLSKPKEVEDWISSLPMANIGETSRQVFKTLVEFNRMEIPNLPRIKVAEMFRRPIRYLSDNLKKYYYDASFPLSAKNRKIAVLNRELYMELATAYKIVIVEMIGGDARKIDRKVLVVAIQRAIRCLSSVLYQSVIVYDPYPEPVWGEIHRLYAYAEQNRIHELPVKDAQRTRATTSIRELYVRAMLFAIISPYRLRQREIEHCYAQLGLWSAHVVLSTTERLSTSESLFLSRLGSNRPPAHIKLQSPPIDRHCRQLDTDALVDLLRRVRDGTAPTRGAGEVFAGDDSGSEQLLGKLIQVLSRVQKRKYVRTRLNFELSMVVGLAAVHSLLRQPIEEPEPVEETETLEEEMSWFVPREEKPLINVPATTSNHAHVEFNNEPEVREYDAVVALDADGVGYYGGMLPAWVTASDDRVPEPFSCTTDNESAWGYCIQWPVANTSRIRVGELLGIRVSATRTLQYRIGVSRWLRNLPGQGIQVGLEIISLSSSAVRLTRTGPGAAGSPAIDCILLPESQAAGQHATLLTPMQPFVAKDVVSLDDARESRTLRLTRLIESTGTFCRFEFKVL